MRACVRVCVRECFVFLLDGLLLITKCLYHHGSLLQSTLSDVNVVRDESVPPSVPIPRRMNKRISLDGPCTAVDFLSCDSTGAVLETEISI